MYMGSTVKMQPVARPAMNLAANSMAGELAKAIRAQDKKSSTESPSIVGLRPSLSARMPAGMGPTAAPSGVRLPTHAASLADSSNVAFSPENLDSDGDVQHSTHPAPSAIRLAAGKELRLGEKWSREWKTD